ncbi:hypothetical protein TNCV_1871331 [Trichonephila clavipes]|nr:hypothetical protein TNCV_1871331 [Trichonephila clavipes]
MSRSGGQSEVKPPVFKSPSKLSTHLSTYCKVFFMAIRRAAAGLQGLELGFFGEKSSAERESSYWLLGSEDNGSKWLPGGEDEGG